MTTKMEVTVLRNNLPFINLTGIVHVILSEIQNKKLGTKKTKYVSLCATSLYFTVYM